MLENMCWPFETIFNFFSCFFVTIFFLEITIQSKSINFKVASKFADFGRTSFTFKIAHFVNE